VGDGVHQGRSPTKIRRRDGFGGYNEFGPIFFQFRYFNSKKFIWWELEPVTLPKYAHGVHKSVSKKNCCR